MSGAQKVCPQCGTEYPANARFCEIDGTALRGAATGGDLVGQIIADRYHVMKKLGEGGMGQVYLVEHVKMGRKSALKVMHPGMVKDIDAISRFNREAANASRIAHANVAAVYDFGETPDGIIYLAMEFVDGPPLTSVIEQAGALPAKRAAEIVRQTAEALAVAHDMGIVHRDLKPDNIMIAKTRDGDDLVKVVDFGIAKANNAAQKVTKTGLVVGTPEYMSPEQLAGDKLDGRSDIYSLGLVAFNMLTGKLPFPSDSAQESMIMRLTDRPKPLAEMRPEVVWPEDVQAVMDKALERDASLRYQTATEFGRDLVRAIDRMPETQAAEIGTQMMSVPPTRVAPDARVSAGTAGPSASPAASGVGTVSVPLPVSSVPVTQTAAPTTRKNMIPIVGGIAAVIVGLVIAMPIILNRNHATADTSKVGGQAQTPVTPQATGPSTAPGAGSRADTASRTAQPTSQPRGAQVSMDIGQVLKNLERDVADSAKAGAVLSGIAKALPQAKLADDSAHAEFIRYKAYLNQNNTDAACRSIHEAATIAVDPQAKGRYAERDRGCRG
ncbi:MAG: protein kinase [bacterium]